MNQKKNRAPCEASSSLRPDANLSLRHNMDSYTPKFICLPIHKREDEDDNIHPGEQIELFSSVSTSQLCIRQVCM